MRSPRQAAGQSAGTGSDANRVLRDSDGSLDVLRRLRALGVRIALTISAPLFLTRLPEPHIFKQAQDRRQLVRSDSDAFGIDFDHPGDRNAGELLPDEITAEGVETHEDYQRMQTLGCHQMQGYLFGRPVPFERATELVGTRWSEARRLAKA